MKIQQLFNALIEKSAKENTNEIFAESGMINRFNELDYGFFPLGSGILSEQSKTEEAEISEHGVMVLGNDFGTVNYVTHKCPGKRENVKGSTIRNLLKLELDRNNTFFTNFYLGLRSGSDATMTKRGTRISEDYKKFCYDFYLTQLDFINPRLILCLGKDIENVLRAKWIDSNLLKKYNFQFIPHPSFAHINWNETIRIKINDLVNTNQKRVSGIGKGMLL